MLDLLISNHFQYFDECKIFCIYWYIPSVIYCVMIEQYSHGAGVFLLYVESGVFPYNAQCKDFRECMYSSTNTSTHARKCMCMHNKCFFLFFEKVESVRVLGR